MFINIHDGKKTYEIKNQNGEVIGSVTFNPTDTNILRKCDSVLNEIFDFQKIIDNNPDSLIQAEENIKKTINDLFGSDVSTPFFAIVGPLTVLEDGKCFAEKVVESLVEKSKEEMKKHGETAKNRMDEYLEDYKK